MHLSCIVILKFQKNSPRRDSNPQPPDPKSDALSIAPLGHLLEYNELLTIYGKIIKNRKQKNI